MNTDINSIPKATETVKAAGPTGKEQMAQADYKASGNPPEIKKNYKAISKDGDTLELSKRNTSLRYSDAALSKLSAVKLKQLLADEQISKQQYDKALKR